MPLKLRLTLIIAWDLIHGKLFDFLVELYGCFKSKNRP